MSPLSALSPSLSSLSSAVVSPPTTPLYLHLLVVARNVDRNFWLWDDKIQNFNPILAQPTDAILNVSSNIGDNIQKHGVVHLVNCVVGTEDSKTKV